MSHLTQYGTSRVATNFKEPRDNVPSQINTAQEEWQQTSKNTGIMFHLTNYGTSSVAADLKEHRDNIPLQRNFK